MELGIPEEWIEPLKKLDSQQLQSLRRLKNIQNFTRIFADITKRTNSDYKILLRMM